MSTENQVDLSVLSIDEIIASGDPDAIEAAMAQVDSLATEVDVDFNDSSIVEANAEQEQAADAPVITEQAIATKDGNNTIPFQVLSDTRTALSETQGQLTTVAEQNAELTRQLDEQNRLNALAKDLLESNNLKIPVLPEYEKIDPEFLKNSSDYGEIGEALRIVAQQNETLQRQIQSQVAPKVAAPDSVSANPAQEAFDANPAMQKIFNDPAQKELAIAMDIQMRSSHSHLTIAERFDEIVKNINQHQATEDITIPKKPPVPASMSDTSGATPQIQSTTLEKLENATGVEIDSAFEGMTAEALNDLIDQM